MQKILRPLLAVVFVAAIIAFAFSYTVRFTESAVVTTFGKAGDKAVIAEPGLKFKWPYPIQSVTKYDNRLRVLQTRSQTQVTAEDSQVIVEAFATWRVSDPLLFFQRFSGSGAQAEDHFEQAEDILRTTLRSAMGEISKYRLDELFSDVPGESKFGELEERVYAEVLAGVQSQEGLSESGIEVAMVGINRVVLPENTTAKVIDRMGSVRNNLAGSLESQGDARANAIRARADADAEKIKAFAERRAAEILAKGEFEAAEYLAQQDTSTELAIFLQQIEMMKDAMAKRFTLVLSASDFGLGLFSPSATSRLQGGEIPGGLPAGASILRRDPGESTLLADDRADNAEGATR